MFGQRLKKLRREKDMTQEDLAEVLNISPQAVSRWETDLAMPDISIFPSLAYLFNVTTDFLLGVDIANKEKSINDIIQKVENNWKSKPFREHIQSTIDMLREGLKLYPDSFILQNKLANNLNALPEKKDHIPEIIKLCENILAKCTENKIRYSTTQTLIFAYLDSNEKEKARELAENLPDYILTSNETLKHIETGVKKRTFIQSNIWQLLHCLEMNLQGLIFIKNDDETGIWSWEEKIKLYEKMIELNNIIFEENENKKCGNLSLAGKYYFMFVAKINQHECWNNPKDKEIYIDEALNYLEESVKYKTAYYNQIYDDNNQSLIFRSSIIIEEYLKKSEKEVPNSCTSTIINLSNKNFDYLRDNKRFKDIIAMLEKYAKK